MDHCSVERWMAQPALPPGEGAGTSAVRIGKGHCRRWLFLMNGWMKNNQTPTVKNKSHSLCQPSPQGWCFSEHCAFCECRCLVLLFTSNDPWETAPHGAQLLCCRMPEPILKMLWVETGVLFTAAGLCFICLGLMKEKVIDMGSTLPFCSAFLAFWTPVSCRNWVLFGMEVHRQMWTLSTGECVWKSVLA